MKRGEVYYIEMGDVREVGSEQKAGRPAVIVSNDKCNETSDVVEVVYLTTQSKPDMSTHVATRATGRASTVLCEQICSVSKQRIGNYAGECSAAEMQLIDIALLASLGLGYLESQKEEEKQKPDEKPVVEIDAETVIEIIRLEAERDTYKELYDGLITKLLRKQRESRCAK